jgi:hypothetical protein
MPKQIIFVEDYTQLPTGIKTKRGESKKVFTLRKDGCSSAEFESNQI